MSKHHLRFLETLFLTRFAVARLDHQGDIQTLGNGVEREVIYNLFLRYQEASSEYFAHRDDGFSSLKTVYPMSMSHFIPRDRLLALTKLGALCALSMIEHQIPGTFSPLIFQLIVHKFNVHSLHPAIVGEWQPAARKLILDWIAAGPDGNIDTPEFQAHFANFHDQEVC